MAVVEDYLKLATFLFDFGLTDEAKEVSAQALNNWGGDAELAFADLNYLINNPPVSKSKDEFVLISGSEEEFDELEHERTLEAVHAGDLDAADRMGTEMLEILGPQEAITFHKIAAEGGHPSGQNHLAEDYLEIGDTDKAFHWFSKAAEGGHPSAQNNLAMMYLERSQPHLAYPWFRKSADAGNEAGKNNLAELIANEGDFKGALLVIQDIAEAGNTLAQNNAGLLHANLGNESEAKRFWLLAAQKAEKNALFNLGVFFEQTGDEFLSKQWLTLAARRGHEVAKSRLGILIDEPEYDNSIGDFELSIDLYEMSLELERAGKLDESKEAMQRSAELGFSEAQYDMGIRLIEEWSQGEDSDEALRTGAMDWFVKAARQGHDDATQELRDALTPESFRNLGLE